MAVMALKTQPLMASETMQDYQRIAKGMRRLMGQGRHLSWSGGRRECRNPCSGQLGCAADQTAHHQSWAVAPRCNPPVSWLDLDTVEDPCMWRVFKAKA